MLKLEYNRWNTRIFMQIKSTCRSPYSWVLVSLQLTGLSIIILFVENGSSVIGIYHLIVEHPLDADITEAVVSDQMTSL